MRDKLSGWVEERIRAHFDETERYPSTTTYGRCLMHLGEAALSGGGYDHIEDLQHAEPFGAISAFVWHLAMSAVDYGAPVVLDFWRHQRSPVQDVRHDCAHELDRPQIEVMVDQYLDLPVKAAYVDRLLLDMLAGCELIAYAKVVYGKVSELEPPLYDRSNVLTFAKGRAKSAALWLVLYAVASLLKWESAQTVIFWLGVVETVIGFGIYPFAQSWVNKRNEKVLKPLRAMQGVYADLDSTGSISARHILDQATKARDAGVGWPGPLFVLLDDVIARGGRI